MKTKNLFLFIIIGIIIGCDDDKKETAEVNFYDNSHRIGTWISEKYTLNFTDNETAIIQFNKVKHKVKYKIENENLLINWFNEDFKSHSLSCPIKIIDANNIELKKFSHPLSSHFQAQTHFKKKG